MKIKASGRWALMLATGLILCAAGPLPAKAASSDPAASKSDTASSGKSVRQSSRHSKHTADRKSSKAAEKTADKPAETKKAADAADTGNNAPPAVIPASIANANAELPASDNASTMTAKANSLLAATDNKPAGQPDADVVASDELNDVDRALQQATPETPPQPQQQAQVQVQAPPQQPTTVAMASARPVLASVDNSTWDQTSLIGKIFIAFGALLTVASAARMFMA